MLQRRDREAEFGHPGEDHRDDALVRGHVDLERHLRPVLMKTPDGLGHAAVRHGGAADKVQHPALAPAKLLGKGIKRL